MKEFLHNVIERIRSVREGRTMTEFELGWDDDGVTIQWRTIENKRGSESFRWDSVVAVDAFKRDFFTVDCICLAFQTSERWFEINEDMKGWKDFLTAVEKRLNGFPKLDQWYRSIAFPAFATNHSTLWRKER